VNGGLLELVDQPASLGIFADDLPAIIKLRLRAINRYCEFDPQPSGYAARRDIGRATGNPSKKKAVTAKPRRRDQGEILQTLSGRQGLQEFVGSGLEATGRWDDNGLSGSSLDPLPGASR
jgi:hypothetical protein